MATKRRKLKPWIPDDAEWFLADIVESIEIAGDPRIRVHINTMLIHAGTPDDAYAKAMALGRQCNQAYRNESGAKVTSRFLGTRELNVVHDKLEHGAELSYTLRIVRSLKKAKALVRPKSRFVVFAPRRPPADMDFAAGDLVQKMREAGISLPPRRKRAKSEAHGARKKSRRT